MLPVAADGTCRAPESSAKTNRMKQHAKRVIAFYLPQYHPFPENDRWWGAGFTEWRNVVKARPLFRGHYQPHLPADLGFYDLRVPEVRQQQAALAERYGLSGFCYYHYWFNGHRLMQRPVEEMLASGKPDFPFMLCWANENWTRAWDGGEQEVLIRQEYSEEDDRAHIRYLLDEVFRDPRYIRVDGKPVFAVYRSALFPDMRRTIEVWRGGGRPRRGTLSLPRGEFQRRRTRRAGGRIRRCDRVPALHSCDDRFLGASSVAAEAHVPPAQIVGRPPQDAQSRLRRLRRIQPEPSGPRL